MSKENTFQTILFANIRNTLNINKILGDENAQSLLKSSIYYLSTIVQEHMGTILKTKDNGLLCAFNDANQAVDAGKTMHLDFDQIHITDEPQFVPPSISVGMHFGQVIVEGDNVSGDAIKVLNQLEKIVGHRQMITTQETIDHFTKEIQSLLKPLDSEKTENINSDQKIYEIIWEIDGLSDFSQSASGKDDKSNLRTCLELRMNDILIEVDQNNSAVTIGRQPHNNLVVREKPVSRTHACIAYREGKFVLIDESSNGTFVLIEGKKMKRVLKDEIVLTDNGVIGVGKKADPSLPGIIHYSLQYRSQDK